MTTVLQVLCATQLNIPCWEYMTLSSCIRYSKEVVFAFHTGEPQECHISLVSNQRYLKEVPERVACVPPHDYVYKKHFIILFWHF